MECGAVCLLARFELILSGRSVALEHLVALKAQKQVCHHLRPMSSLRAEGVVEGGIEDTHVEALGLCGQAHCYSDSILASSHANEALLSLRLS